MFEWVFWIKFAVFAINGWAKLSYHADCAQRVCEQISECRVQDKWDDDDGDGGASSRECASKWNPNTNWKCKLSLSERVHFPKGWSNAARLSVSDLSLQSMCRSGWIRICIYVWWRRTKDYHPSERANGLQSNLAAYRHLPRISPARCSSRNPYESNGMGTGEYIYIYIQKVPCGAMASKTEQNLITYSTKYKYLLFYEKHFLKCN